MEGLAPEATSRNPDAMQPGALMYLYFRLGGVEQDEGTPQQALVYFRRALDVAIKWDGSSASLNSRERAAASDSQNVNARRVLVGCIWRLAAMWADDKPELALEYARRAVQISEDLHAADPMNVESRYHASRGYVALGESSIRMQSKRCRPSVS